MANDYGTQLAEYIIKTAAIDPSRAIANCRRMGGYTIYSTAQCARMSTLAAASGLGGIATGAALTVSSLIDMFRCASKLTYAYGSTVAHLPVDKDDFIGVLAIWLGTDPQNIFVYSNPSLATTTPEDATKAVSFVSVERLMVNIGAMIGKIFAAKTAGSAVPLASSLVMSTLSIRDFLNISKAIQRYYDEKRKHLC